MPRHRRSLFVPFILALVVTTQAQAPPGGTASVGVGAPAEMVGRWLLIATIRNGEDITQGGVTQSADAFVYDFKADGTFSIARGDTIAETGIWAANEKATPKTFDHRRYVNGQLGRLLPGIYEAGGGALKICLFPPSESNARPPSCEAKQENRSSIYIMKRDVR